MKKTRQIWGAALALAAVIGMSACSSDAKVDEQQSGQSGTPLAEEVTEEGRELTAAFENCDAIADLITGIAPSSMDGLQPIVSAFGEDQQTLCEWQSTDGGVIDVQIAPYAQSVPTTEQIEAQNGVIIESEAISEAGGALYAVPVQDAPSAVWGVMPYGQVILQFAGVESYGFTEEVAVEVVEELLGL